MEYWSYLLREAIRIAKEAGKIQLSYFRKKSLSVLTKQNEYDVVTTADKTSEDLIVSKIKKLFPGHSIVSEELSNVIEGNEDYRWIIDPLDGTTNYSQGLPVFCISIAIEYRGTSVVGVVYAPYLNELYYAVKGSGAFQGDNRIRCSSKNRLEESVVATGIPYDKLVNPDNNIKELSKVAPMVRGLRRLGSAAMDLCYVAAGYFEAYWELNLNLWDVAAGVLIAREAGAKIFPIRENRNHSVLAACPGICDAMLEILLTPDIQSNSK
ncbi:MAG: inositol monophosphatase [Bacteroides sp.]|nr:inositol monophosphatase [Bacteroides sp.]